jgi:hypothetical protein
MGLMLILYLGWPLLVPFYIVVLDARVPSQCRTVDNPRLSITWFSSMVVAL